MKIISVVIWETWRQDSPVIFRHRHQMRGTCASDTSISIDVVWVVREYRRLIWHVWKNMLRDIVLRIRVWPLLVWLNTVFHAGTRRRHEVTAWVISTVRLAWIVCKGKSVVWLSITEIGGVILEWVWHVGRFHWHSSWYRRNLGMHKIGWRKIWGGQVYFVFRSRDRQTWRCSWFRRDKGLDSDSIE